MERKIGEVFTYNGKTYQVVKSIVCTHCAFRGKLCGLIEPSAGNCMPSNRSDKTSVIFKEINNMEIKNNQLTIDIPEGMEIDLENSDLAKGIIKFRNKWLTIAEIVACEYLNSSIIVSTSTRKKIIAISNLMDIAKYFNGNWKYKVNSGERGYMIAYDNSIKKPYYKVNTIYPTTDVYYGNPIFKNEDDAQYVIDNPNFRDILDAIYKN
nr:MAG TPA: hypothetical protein [Caudoviricetes sp.]